MLRWQVLNLQRDQKAKQLTVSAYETLGGTEEPSGLRGRLNLRAIDVYNSLRETEQAWAQKDTVAAVADWARGEGYTAKAAEKSAVGNGWRGYKQHAQARKDITCVIADLVKGGLPVTYSEAAQSLECGEALATLDAVGDIEDETESATGYVDLAHEALIDGWAQFVLWRQEDRDLRRLVQRLVDEYEGWKQAKENKAIEKFERAKALDPKLTIDAVARANQLAEWSKAK